MLTLSLSGYPEITLSSNMNPSMGQKMTVGDNFYQTDERLLFEKLTKTAELIGHSCLLRQK